MQSLWTALSALRSSNNWLDQVGSNIANENTPGYAAEKSSFTDAYTRALSGQATAPQQAGRYTPTGWWGGSGVIATNVERDFSQLPIQPTGNPMDLAISGDGFFLVRGQDGNVHLTKAGNLQWSMQANGSMVLANSAGDPILDTNGRPILAPAQGVDKFSVSALGDVTFPGASTGAAGTNAAGTNAAGTPGASTTPQRIAIAAVAMPSQTLTEAGDGEYVAGAGSPVGILNATGGQGTANSQAFIQQGALDMSNVDLTVEMTQMIQAQRMFDLNAEGLQFTNRMMTDDNSIRA